MPLFELFRLAKGKLDPSQDKPNTADSSSGGPGNGFSELAWENGQVVMQGQCSPQDKKSLSLNTDDDGNEGNARASKIRNLSFGLSQFPSRTVPSPEIGLNQEDDMVPWMSYPLSGSLNNDYSLGFLPELPGVVVNVTTRHNNIGSVSKTDQGQACRDSIFSLLQNGNGLEEATRMKSSNAQLFSSSLPPQSHLLPCPSLNLQRTDSVPSQNASSTMNFSCVVRPTAVVRSNYDSSNKIYGLSSLGEERAGSWDMDAAVDTTASRNSKPVVSGNGLGKGPVPGFGYDLEFLEGKSSKEPVSYRKNEAVTCEDTMKGKEDKFSNQSWRLSGTKGVVADGEKNVEAPGGSSSVCSGNSVERASDDPKHGLKRKSHETVQSDDCSEDVGEELVSAKKQAIVRQTPLKRSRTAEVHNLSERRRRDRINEKMRALQELIPNCSKVDKASMLDEAIEYVKSLKLQLQMVMLGGGFYVPPMMLPAGMLQHIGHFPFQMGHGMECGMGMAKMYMQGPHSMAPLMPGFNAMPGSNLHMYGFHGQGLLPRTPMVPFPGRPWMKTSTGPSNAYGEPVAVENHHQVTVSSGKEFDRHSSLNTVSSCLSKQQQSSQSLVISSGGQASDKKNNARGASDMAKREKHRPRATGA